MSTVKRVIWVLGASSGIGRAIVDHLLEQDHTVVGSSRTRKTLPQNHPRFHFIEMNLLETERIAEVVKQIQQDFPALDAVVFSAGYGQFGSLEEFSFSQIEQLMTVDFTAQALATRALLPKLKRQPRVNLIYIGSEASLQGSRKGSIYCAAKFALRGFTQSLRDECGKSSVRVSLINPGMVDTAFFDALSFMPGEGESHALQAEDVAEAVNYVLQAGHHMVVDEINLNPASKVVRFK